MDVLAWVLGSMLAIAAVVGSVAFIALVGMYLWENRNGEG